MTVSRTPAQAGELPGVLALQWSGFTVRMHTDLKDIGGLWDGLGCQNIFLSSAYLNALHAAPPETMSFAYFTIFREDQLAGILFVQIDTFKARDSISYHKDAEQPSAPTPGVMKRIRAVMAQRVQVRTLLCGNSLVTGEHGFLFIDTVSEQERWELVDKVLHWHVHYLKKIDVHIQLIFVKDFFTPAAKRLHMTPTSRVYHGFHAQPNMIMHLDPGWKSFDEYLESLSSKYRVRVRRAFKKAAKIEKRELTLEDLIEHRDKIIEYYRDIAENASFNLFILSPDYFISVKKYLGARFKVYGYFSEGKLIAFYTLMINGEEVEAHFLGYEEETNRACQLYHNMLLDMIDLSITLGVERIIFGRTAMEIKSSVGAVPEYMYFYLQYQNALINPFVSRVYNALEPEVEWVQRNPFRDGEQES